MAYLASTSSRKRDCDYGVLFGILTSSQLLYFYIETTHVLMFFFRVQQLDLLKRACLLFTGVLLSIATLLLIAPAAHAGVPTVDSAVTADSDEDGEVDQINITFSEEVSIADFGSGLLTMSADTSCVIDNFPDYSNPATTSLTVELTNCPQDDTSVTPTITYSESLDGCSGDGAICSTSTNDELADATPIPSTDGAAPVALNIDIFDQSSPRGFLDRGEITYSEPVADVPAGSHGFDVELGASLFGPGMDCTAESTDPDGTDTVVLTFDCTNGPPNTAAEGSGFTASTFGLTVDFTQNPNIADVAGNESVDKLHCGNSVGDGFEGDCDNFIVEDKAAPVISSISYRDGDTNGRIDAIAVLFSETVDTNNSQLAADDLTVSDPGDFTGVSIVAGAADLLDIDDSLFVPQTDSVDIGMTESSVVSTHDTSGNFDVEATNPGGSDIVLQDVHGNSTSSSADAMGPGFIGDAAPPVLKSTTPTGGSTDVDPSSQVIVEFSEEMVSGLDPDATEITVDGAPVTADSLVWNDDVDQLEFQFTGGLTPEATYTFLFFGEDPDAGGGPIGCRTPPCVFPVYFSGSGADYSMSAFNDPGGTNFYTSQADTGPLSTDSDAVDATPGFSFTTGEATGGGAGSGGDSCSGVPGEVCIPGTGSVPVEETACEVTSPNGGEVLSPEETTTVTWNTSSTIDNINLLYSINDGDTWRRVQSGLANDGEYEWTVPDVNTAGAKVRIDCRDPGGAVLFSDTSDEVLTIGDPSDPTEETEPVEEPIDIDVNPGDLIKLPNDGDPTTYGDTSVYVIGTDGERHPFPSEQIYRTWYPDFDDINIISKEKMAAIQLGDPILVRPGTRWVKIQSNPKVFYVEPGSAVLRHIADEQTAERLGGEDWSDNVIDIPATCFNCYEIGDPITYESLDESWPSGSLMRAPNEQGINYIDEGYLRPITSGEAMEANGFQERFVQVNDEAAWMNLPMGFFITDYEERLFLDIMTP